MNQQKVRGGCIVLLIISLILLLISVDTYALGMRGYYLGRKYVFNGSVTLSYWRFQADDLEPEETFTHRYALRLRGYIVHPRLLTFNLGTSYSKNHGTTKSDWHLHNSIQLNILPYKPLNLSLRYSRSDSDIDNDYNAYGLTITYTRTVGYGTRGMRGFRRMNNKKPGFLKLILPITTVFDLDRMEYADSKRTLASLRLKGGYKKTSYNLGSSYSIEERKGGEEITRATISLDTSTHINVRHRLGLGGDYAVREAEDTTTDLFLYGDFAGRNKKNNLFYGLHADMQRYGEQQEVYYVSADTTRVHTLAGNMRLQYSVRASYRRIDRDSYGLSGDVGLSKALSKVVTMSTGLGVTVGNAGNATFNLQLYERPSRRFSFSQYYHLLYGYGSELSEENRGFAHRLGASANMRLHRRLFTSASAYYYTKHEFQNIGGSISAGTWLWRFGLRTGIGGSETTSDGNEYQNYQAFITVSGNIIRGLHMVVDTRYLYKSQDDLRMTIVRPHLYWNWRRMSARLEYEYAREESSIKDPTTTHKLFIIITRYFGRVFYR
jgi:hypothetical protein